MAVTISRRQVIGFAFDPGASPGYFTLYSDQGGSVKLQPEFDYDESFIKDETRHRSLTGAEFAYTWGFYKKWKFSVEFVDSAGASQVNSWWQFNHDLKFRFLGNPPEDVRIVNRAQPFTKRMRGPFDLRRGVIELETYA